MLRGLAFLLLLLGVGLLGCSESDDAQPENIPDIPPGRSLTGPEAGGHLPVVPPPPPPPPDK